MVDNDLFCEPLIIEKLKQDIPDLVDVSGAADLASLDAENPTTPCAYVIYAGDVNNISAPATGGIGRQVQFTTQLWTVVLCVYLTDGRSLGSDMSEIAGPFITKIKKSLRGFVPAKICTPMAKYTAQIVPVYDDGYCYIPITFYVQFPEI